MPDFTLTPVDGDPFAGAPNAPTATPVEGNPFASLGLALGASTAGFYDKLVAGMQGTTPEAATNLQFAPEGEQWLLREQGDVSDPQKYVRLRDPKTGQYGAFIRNPETERGASFVGEVLGRASELSQIAPYMLPATAPVVVGAATALTPAQRLLQDYERSGVPPTAPAVGQSAAAGLVSQGMRFAPVVGPVVSKAAGESLAGTASAAERIAGDYLWGGNNSTGSGGCDRERHSGIRQGRGAHRDDAGRRDSGADLGDERRGQGGCSV